MFSGEMRNRGRVAVEHRIPCGWMKYNALQHVFEDKHIPLKLRLKLFDSAITSTVLHSLESCLIHDKLFHRLDVVQRKMLRRIIGWISHSDETWDERGRQMKKRFQKCMESYPVSDRSVSIHIRETLIEPEIENLPFLSSSALRWDPVACSSANLCCL